MFSTIRDRPSLPLTVSNTFLVAAATFSAFKTKFDIRTLFHDDKERRNLRAGHKLTPWWM